MSSHVQVYAPWHPKASSSGCVYQHILTAEKALGRLLPTGAEVHHIDGNPRNNANSNLVICQDKAYHKLLHVRAKIVAAGGNPNTDKFCRDCGLALPLEMFSKSSGNKSTGRQAVCKPCHYKRTKANRERRKAVAA